MQGQSLPDWTTRHGDYEALLDANIQADFTSRAVMITCCQLRDALRAAGNLEAWALKMVG